MDPSEICAFASVCVGGWGGYKQVWSKYERNILCIWEVSISAKEHCAWSAHGVWKMQADQGTSRIMNLFLCVTGQGLLT